MSDDTPLTLREGEATLRVRVTALSAHSSAGGTYRDAEGRTALVVRATVPPEKGKANEAVIATLAKSLKVAKSRLTITAGLADRNKTVAVAGDPTEFEPALGGLLKSELED